jgi:two-component system response regulator RegX3
MTRVLVVEDEASLRDPLVYQLTREGFEVVEAATGPDALERFAEHEIDLVLLDLMLPGLAGTEVCSRIRATSNVPVIMLTAKDSEVDKVVGLEIGADDYVTKPYSFRELLARVRAVLRRYTETGEPTPGGIDEDDEILTVGAVVLDVARHQVTVSGTPVELPLKEFDLLEYFMSNPGRVLTRGQLIDRVWGDNYFGDTKTLDVHIKRLRNKIEPDPANPTVLLTIRGVGYRLAD